MSFTCIFLFFSCSYIDFRKKEDCKKEAYNKDKIIAECNNKILRLSDLSHLLSEAKDKDDSFNIINKYSLDWAKTIIYQDLIKKFIPDEMELINKKAEEYKLSLIIHTYQNYYLANKLDTSIDTTEIKIFYEKNKNFYLTEDIIKCLIIQVPLSYVNIKKLKLTSDNNEEISKICEKYAFKCVDYTNEWYELDIIIKDNPRLFENKRNLFKGGIYEYSDSVFHYFLIIKDIKYKGEKIPEDYFAKKIFKPFIIAERKKRLIKDLEENMIKNYMKKNKLKFYY